MAGEKSISGRCEQSSSRGACGDLSNQGETKTHSDLSPLPESWERPTTKVGSIKADQSAATESAFTCRRTISSFKRRPSKP
ncbi:unnamed protein product [Zymoseptoria tritici ST99CH_1E4]|uniref:Uncharacterized protein n=1 Tax=Zymoseptoria tritici ST99CH_1E4 TaxID=1276532 RepID=A0A2H1FPQ2_ZYMTR|nr:unnamed protein product [Zymoseptoria tritici ST99CH_1E4]